MHIQDADVGLLTQKRKVLSNKEKLSILLDQVTPQDQLKDAVKGKIIRILQAWVHHSII